MKLSNVSDQRTADMLTILKWYFSCQLVKDVCCCKCMVANFMKSGDKIDNKYIVCIA